MPILLGATGCKQINARKSAEVNDAVIYQHKQLMASLETFIENLETGDADLIAESLGNLQGLSSTGLTAISELQSPGCNSEFLPAAEGIFEFYNETASNGYASIARFYTMDSITYEQYDSLQVVVKEVEEAQRAADSRFLDAQQTFARDCGFKLVRNIE